MSPNPGRVLAQQARSSAALASLLQPVGRRLARVEPSAVRAAPASSQNLPRNLPVTFRAVNR